MAHTRSLPLPPPGQKDVTSAQACCHQRLAEQTALLSSPLPVPPPVALLSLALCLSLYSLYPSLRRPAPGACPVARLILDIFWRNIWISRGVEALPQLPEERRGGMARPEDTIAPHSTWLALHSPSPPFHPKNPLDSPGLPCSRSDQIASSSQGDF